MRFITLTGLLALTLFVSLIESPTGAVASESVRPPAAPGRLAGIADHYRRVTWTYQRAARAKRTPSTLSYRRPHARAYLQWTINLWQDRARAAQERALAAIHRRAEVALPQPPPARASLVRRIVFHQALTWRLQKVYPGRTTPASTTFRETRSAAYRQWALHLWQQRAARAALQVSLHPLVERRLASSRLVSSFECIHRFEGPWTANTGNGYYGGLQMDWSFMRAYGGDFLARWGTADRWPAWAQIETASRAHASGRGFSPWPNTARFCGLL